MVLDNQNDLVRFRERKKFRNAFRDPGEALLSFYTRSALPREHSAKAPTQSGGCANGLFLLVDLFLALCRRGTGEVGRITHHRNGPTLPGDLFAQPLPFFGVLDRRETPIEFQSIDVKLLREIDPL